MSDLAILVPVLRRPWRVTPFLDAVELSTPSCRVVFLADVGDVTEIEAIKDEQRGFRRPFSIDLAECHDGTKYSEKVNRGVRLTSEPYIFTAADDLEPQAGWFEAARGALTGGIEAVGVNDLIERRRSRREHATHFLLTREYAETPMADGTAGVFFEGYDHSWCDNEFIATATARCVYAYVADAQVRHLHPMNGTAADDPVYQKGRERFHEDRRIFESRQPLWTAAA